MGEFRKRDENMGLNFGQSLFERKAGTKTVGVFGQGGLFGGIVGQELDFEFGDIIVYDSPDERVFEKFEGNFFFGHTFQGATLNAGIWNESTGANGTVTQANNIVTLDAKDDTAEIRHRIFLQQTRTGDILFEAKIRRNADGANSICRVGLIDALGGAWAYFELNTDEDTWRPVVDRTATTNGTDFTVANNSWVKFKIILTTDSASFYVDDALKETLTGANVPDDRAIGILFRAEEAAADSCVLNIEWCKVEYGADL